jgi:hypothetical protein
MQIPIKVAQFLKPINTQYQLTRTSRYGLTEEIRLICSSLNLLVLMSIILQVDGLLGKMTGTVYGGQIKYWIGVNTS